MWRSRVILPENYPATRGDAVLSIYQHFGMAASPFAVTPDPRFAYQTREHQLALLKAMYSIQEERGVFLLRGEIGGGKTTLARYMKQQLDMKPDKYAVAYLNSPVTRSHAGLLREVLQAFGQATARNLADLNRLMLRFLLDARKDERTVVLMLDEAQMLSTPSFDLLHTLSNHQTLSTQLLQVILFAQPNIDNKLEQRPALTSRITGAAYLGVLAFEDAIDLLRFRTSVVGGDFDIIFPEGVHKTLYNASGGLARDLCVYADSALVTAFARGLKQIDDAAIIDAAKDLEFKKRVRK
jgi:type II secretory pathway predicted ATPase ExeA